MRERALVGDVTSALAVLVIVAGSAAADSAVAPLPGHESGRTDRGDHGASLGRELARGALFLPKVLVEIVLAPVRAAVWADERFALTDRYYHLLYSADRKIGLVPTATYQTGFGITFGARFFDRELGSAGEHVLVQATYGGHYLDSASVWLGTGHRLGRLELGVGGNVDRRPDDPFYGIGNGDLVSAVAAPVDPRSSDVAAQTALRYAENRAAASADLRIGGGLHVIGRGELTELSVSGSSYGTPIGAVYDVDDVVGFGHPVRHFYGELELRWDTRRRASPWEASSTHSTGGLASVFAGPVAGLDGAASFWHYGGELQRYVHLGSGPRVLALRMRAEGVTGGLDQVPVSELPALGGDLLRGYPYGRFRDRLAVFGSVQYEWNVSHYLEAFAFVDAGRVYRSPDAITLDGLRVGYGVGVAVNDDAGGFLAEGSIASSIDGGLILTAAFSPVFDERPRWR